MLAMGNSFTYNIKLRKPFYSLIRRKSTKYIISKLCTRGDDYKPSLSLSSLKGVGFAPHTLEAHRTQTSHIFATKTVLDTALWLPFFANLSRKLHRCVASGRRSNGCFTHVSEKYLHEHASFPNGERLWSHAWWKLSTQQNVTWVRTVYRTSIRRWDAYVHYTEQHTQTDSTGCGRSSWWLSGSPQEYTCCASALVKSPSHTVSTVEWRIHKCPS